MKKNSVILSLLCCFIMAAVVFAAEQNKGAEGIVIKGGSQGDITFPHQQHQVSLKDDCKVCHDLFPQEPGSIEKYKAEKKLKKKQVMNTSCLKCHRENKKQGVKTGPTSCGQCHNK
ncbi:putative cytochrome c, class III family protein [Desulfonema limicola]|uniref:Cytochrome c, class III family protein n=1 Tax=Desulfonema limicola TaxID=45656 RepID=A0A975GFG2_9BACT|nr:cytochrome c3 family protein [Desulfonema limicola]QTA79139.1 putative cytochrome c, class III family protein [Desulfonema limicola]